MTDTYLTRAHARSQSRYGIQYIHGSYCLTIGGTPAVRYETKADALKAYRIFAGELHEMEGGAS